MSVIAVRGFPPNCDLKLAIKSVARAINGNFEALNFHRKGKAKTKTCYFRLSDKLDPVRVIEKINHASFAKKMFLTAFMPETVPDLPLAKNVKIPEKVRKSLKIYHEDPPKVVFEFVIKEILTELQSKYSGLYNLSKKMDHQLLERLYMKIFDRLKALYLRGGPPIESAFHFSSCYRRAHPHFGDFQTVLSTLHAIEDAAGQPRTQIKEADLMASDSNSYTTIDNLPYKEVLEACNKYSQKVNKRLKAHLEGLSTEVSSSDTAEMAARKKIRQELQRMTPYLAMVIKQVIKKHLIPEKTPFHRVRIYGEPFLPSKELTTPFLRRYGAVHVNRSNRMYNLIVFNVHPRHYASLKAMDGTVIGGAKLIIRSSDIPLYKESSQLRYEINALFRDGGGDPMEEQPEFDVY